MAHHFTKTTVEAQAWCLKCGKHTMHRVDGGRIGPCMVCMENLEQQHGKQREKPVTQEGFNFEHN